MMIRTANMTRSRRGAILLMVAICMVPLLGVVALALDVGYIVMVKAELQVAADAAALAAAGEMVYGDPPAGREPSRAAATEFAGYHRAGAETVVLASGDVEFGKWDAATGQFTVEGSPINAIRVSARRDATNSRGPLPLFFARALGIGSADVGAVAIAKIKTGPKTRFLIDDEMIDSDIPSIQTLAQSLGKSAENLISDKNGDWFIDLPPGAKLWLPTGQVGDEGLMDIAINEGKPGHKFPFGSDTDPSHMDFLNYNEDSSSWRHDLIDKKDLDPLRGVGRFNDPVRYPALVNPDAIHVSPIFKSDISALDGVGKPATKGVNALGLRRGLLAFKIIGVMNSPGGGSNLPHLQIEVIDPASVDLETVAPSFATTGTVRLVH